MNGRAPDGLVEALERDGADLNRDTTWMLGVQWHPEETAAEDPAQQRLFDALVNIARFSGASRRRNGMHELVVVPSDPTWPARSRRRRRGSLRSLPRTWSRGSITSARHRCPAWTPSRSIDVQVSVRSMTPTDAYVVPLTAAGYRHVLDPWSDDHEFFSKDTDGERAVNVHLCAGWLRVGTQAPRLPRPPARPPRGRGGLRGPQARPRRRARRGPRLLHRRQDRLHRNGSRPSPSRRTRHRPPLRWRIFGSRGRAPDGRGLGRRGRGQISGVTSDHGITASRFGRALPEGGTIGVCAPSGPYYNRSDLLRPREWWESRGYRVQIDRRDVGAGRLRGGRPPPARRGPARAVHRPRGRRDPGPVGRDGRDRGPRAPRRATSSRRTRRR